jgi:hypothetical protein
LLFERSVLRLRLLLLQARKRLLELVFRLRARWRHRLAHSCRTGALRHRLRLRSDGAREPLRARIAALLLRLPADSAHEALYSAADASALRSAAEHATDSLRAAANSGAHARDETCDAARCLEHASEHLTPTRFLRESLLVGLLVQRLEALLKRVVRVDGVLRLRLEALTPRLTLSSEWIGALPDEASDVTLRLRLRHLTLTTCVLQDVARVDALPTCEARQCADWLRTKTESHGSPFR